MYYANHCKRIFSDNMHGTTGIRNLEIAYNKFSAKWMSRDVFMGQTPCGSFLVSDHVSEEITESSPFGWSLAGSLTLIIFFFHDLKLTISTMACGRRVANNRHMLKLLLVLTVTVRRLQEASLKAGYLFDQESLPLNQKSRQFRMEKETKKLSSF